MKKQICTFFKFPNNRKFSDWGIMLHIKTAPEHFCSSAARSYFFSYFPIKIIETHTEKPFCKPINIGRLRVAKQRIDFFHGKPLFNGINQNPFAYFNNYSLKVRSFFCKSTFQTCTFCCQSFYYMCRITSPRTL